MKRIRTFWECDKCGMVGMIDHPADAGVWEVTQAIADAHRDGASIDTPVCRAPVTDLRVHLGPVVPKRARKAKRK